MLTMEMLSETYVGLKKGLLHVHISAEVEIRKASELLPQDNNIDQTLVLSCTSTIMLKFDQTSQENGWKMSSDQL